MFQLKPIPQYEGLYSLTEDGLVWAHPNNTHFGKWKIPQIPKHKKEPRVVLYKDSKAKTFSLNTLLKITYGDYQ